MSYCPSCGRPLQLGPAGHACRDCGAFVRLKEPTERQREQRMLPDAEITMPVRLLGIALDAPEPGPFAGTPPLRSFTDLARKLYFETHDGDDPCFDDLPHEQRDPYLMMAVVAFDVVMDHVEFHHDTCDRVPRPSDDEPRSRCRHEGPKP